MNKSQAITTISAILSISICMLLGAIFGTSSYAEPTRADSGSMSQAVAACKN